MGTTENDVQLLNQIRKATEMGQYGINSVIDYAADPALYDALTQQYREYDKICDTADRMLQARGATGAHVGKMAKMSSGLSATMNMMMSPTVSRIAEMMIKGNTMGITKGLRSMREQKDAGEETRSLAEKLVATEQSNIEQMKKFL